MTCKEKLMEICPGINWGKVVVSECPSDYNWLCDPDYCSQHCRDGEFVESVCERCWNREIPETPLCRSEEVLDKLEHETENKKEKEEMNCKCELDAMVKQLQFDKDALLEERDELKTKIQRLNETNEDLANKFRAKLNENDDLKEKMKRLNETNEDLANKLAEERVRVDDKTHELSLYKKELDNRDNHINELYARNNNLKEQIKNLRAEKETQAEFFKELCDRIDKMDEVRYIEQDITMTKELYELFRQARPIVIPKEEPIIRPFNELPYVRYARHIRMKYKALTDAGFSHDDAMSLIPMWDDKELNGFKLKGDTNK